MIKNFKQFNEGLRDLMTPKTEKEIDKKIDELYKELINIGMTEGYTQDESIIKDFIDHKWEYIIELSEDGWSTDDIYSDLQMDLEYYCSGDDEDDDEDRNEYY